MEDEKNVPYPSLDGIEEDCASLKIISPAYAGDESELCAILQYSYQAILLKKQGFEKYAKSIEKISFEEMRHMKLLGETICRLGEAPIYTYLPPHTINYFSARSVSYSKTPQKMILDDIIGEQYAIEKYSKMIACLKNERVATVIQRIRMDEMEHLKILKQIMREISG